MVSLFCSELNSGTLVDNSIHDGSELLLVPALESGVTVSTVCLLWGSIYLWVGIESYTPSFPPTPLPLIDKLAVGMGF